MTSALWVLVADIAMTSMSRCRRRVALLVLSLLPAAHSLVHKIKWAQSKEACLLTFEFARSNCTHASASVKSDSFYPSLIVGFKCFADRPVEQHIIRLTDEVNDRATVQSRRGALEVTLQKKKAAIWKDLLSMRPPSSFRIERDWKRMGGQDDDDDDEDISDDDDGDEDDEAADGATSRAASRSARRRAAEAFHQTGVHEQTVSTASVTSSGGVDVLSTSPFEQASADARAHAERVAAMPKSSKKLEALIIEAFAQLESGKRPKTSTVGKLKEAVEASKANKNNARLRAVFGQALAQLGRAEEATVHLRRATELAPSNRGFHQMLASVIQASGAGTDKEALNSYRKGLALVPRDSNAYLNIGELYAKRAREQAVEAFRSAAKSKGGGSKGGGSKGSSGADDSKGGSAGGGSSAISITSSGSSGGGGRESAAEAVSALRSAIEIQPKLAAAYARLAEMVAHQNGHAIAVAKGHVLPSRAKASLAEAKVHARHALSLAPNSVEGYVALARAIVGAPTSAPERICERPSASSLESATAVHQVACLSPQERGEASGMLRRALNLHMSLGEPERTTAAELWRDARSAASACRLLGHLLSVAPEDEWRAVEAEAYFKAALTELRVQPQPGDADYDAAWLEQLFKRADAERQKQKDRGKKVGDDMLENLVGGGFRGEPLEPDMPPAKPKKRKRKKKRA